MGDTKSDLACDTLVLKFYIGFKKYIGYWLF